MKKTRFSNTRHLFLALFALTVLMVGIAWAGVIDWSTVTLPLDFDYSNTYTIGVPASGGEDNYHDVTLTGFTDYSTPYGALTNSDMSNSAIWNTTTGFNPNILKVNSGIATQDSAITFAAAPTTFTKTGAGTLIFTADNTPAPAETIVEAGTLEIKNDGAIGTGAIINSGTFKITDTMLSTARTVSNSGTIEINAAGGPAKLIANSCSGTGSLNITGNDTGTFSFAPASAAECNWVITGNPNSKIDFTSGIATMTGNMENFEGTLKVETSVTAILGVPKVGDEGTNKKVKIDVQPGATLELTGDNYKVYADTIALNDSAKLIIDLTGNSLTYPVVKGQSLTGNTADTKIQVKITGTPQNAPFFTLVNAPSAPLTENNFEVPPGYRVKIDSTGKCTVETQTPPTPEPTPPSPSGFAPATALFNARDGKDLYFQLNGSTRTAMNKPTFRLSLVSEYGKRAALGGDHYKKTDRGIFVSAAFLNSFEEGKYRLEAYDGDKKLSHATLTLVNTSGGGVNPDGSSSSSSGCNTGALSMSLILAAALPLLRRKK